MCAHRVKFVVASRYLHQQLLKNPVIGDGNKDLIVEVLRSVAELMIWGDQHNPAFFECVICVRAYSNGIHTCR